MSGKNTGKFPGGSQLAASQRTAVAGFTFSPPFWYSRVVAGRTTSFESASDKKEKT